MGRKTMTSMLDSVRELDRLLRGEATHPEELSDGGISIPLAGLSIVIFGLAAVYGACMGTYSLFKPIDVPTIAASDRYWQLVATTLKVPLLFTLTLLVTFPSLYVFNALVGSRLKVIAVLQLLVASLGVSMAVLASLGPIVAFFSVSTINYNFIVLFNVLVFVVSGVLGMTFLVQTLNRLSQRPPTTIAGSNIEFDDSGSDDISEGQDSEADDEDSQLEGDDQNVLEERSSSDSQEPGALDAVEGHMLGRHVKLVFRCWMVLFGLVGVQMGWVLRPFVGNPSQPFEWFRARESNFFESVFQTVIRLLTGS